MLGKIYLLDLKVLSEGCFIIVRRAVYRKGNGVNTCVLNLGNGLACLRKSDFVGATAWNSTVYIKLSCSVGSVVINRILTVGSLDTGVLDISLLDSEEITLGLFRDVLTADSYLNNVFANVYGSLGLGVVDDCSTANVAANFIILMRNGICKTVIIFYLTLDHLGLSVVINGLIRSIYIDVVCST